MSDKMLASEVKAESFDKEIDIIKVDPDGLEFNHNILWYIVDWFAGPRLGKQIKDKSVKIIMSHATNDEISDFNNGVNGDKIFAKYRRNFGKNVLTELFEQETRFFNKGSKLMKHFCLRVANADALDDVYNVFGNFKWHDKIILPENGNPDFLSKLWTGYFSNGQSVRNRYRIVKKIYKDYGGGETISIACGSAQPLIHAIYDMKADGKSNHVKLLLTDAEDSALEYSRRRAIQADVLDMITFMKTPFLKLHEKLNDRRFDVVEACGILDYLPDYYAVELLQFAISSLSDRGIIIVSNMAETHAAELLRNLYNWEIVYRSPEYLGRLIKKAGGKDVKVFVEPWGIHPVATARR